MTAMWNEYEVKYEVWMREGGEAARTTGQLFHRVQEVKQAFTLK